MACGCNGAVTNGGAKLIDRARNENKALVFSAVRMNTVYENSIMELVQKSESWFGANVGEVVGCLSHIIIDDVSHVCDAKVAVQCNDNAKAWKTIGIYGHLEGESNDTLIYCESIQNGDFKGTTVVELPVTLDGAVDDFGFSQGGGGDVPANMMTTNTDQSGLSGVKTWEYVEYKPEGGGTEDNPQENDRKIIRQTVVGVFPQRSTLDEHSYRYLSGEWVSEEHQRIIFDGLSVMWVSNFGDEEYSNSALWSEILDAADRPAPQVPAVLCQYGLVEEDPDSQLMLFGQLIEEGGSINYDDLDFTFDSNSHLESVTNNNYPATLSVVVIDDNGAVVGSAYGLSINNPEGVVPVSFSSPIELRAGFRVIFQYIRQATP